VVHSDSSLVNGQQKKKKAKLLICFKATDTRNTHSEWTDGNSGRQDFFPKSYFQQKAYFSGTHTMFTCWETP
jgi:hypothetical protein